MDKELINIIEDHSKLEDVLADICNALETGVIPNTLPSFNDNLIYTRVSYIFDMLSAKKKD